MIKKYRKKPVIIEAIQWDGTYRGMRKIEALFDGLHTMASGYHPEFDTVNYWHIETLGGSLRVQPQDFIIKGTKGEFYPCKPDIFGMTYNEQP